MSGRVRGWCPSLYEPMASGDGLLARVKPPLGRLSADGLRAVAAATEAFGNGQVELTNRGALQVRGLSEATLAPFRAAMLGAHLASADAAVERRRNLVVSPFAAPEALALAAELERWLADDAALAELPSKFGFAVANSDLPIAADISLASLPFMGRGRPRSGQGWGSDDQAPADELDPPCPTLPGSAGLSLPMKGREDWVWRVDLGDRVSGLTRHPLAAAQTIARNFIRLAAAADRPRRMAAIVAQFGAPALFAGAEVETIEACPHPAARAIAGRFGDSFALGLPFGATDAGRLRAAADLAERFGDGGVRLSPWRALVLGGAAEPTASAARLAGFVVDPADPRLSVTACPGAPACASGHAAVRADAARLAAGPLPGHVHLSGCAKGCAHPAPAAFTLVAAADGYGLVRDGRANDPPHTRGLSLDSIARLLAAETP